MAGLHKSHMHTLDVCSLDELTRTTLKTRLDKHSSINIETGCIEWHGANVSGYGQINVNGKTTLSHRLMYALSKGNINKGECVCHKCDNPKCINPEHLFIGTHINNMDDRKAKGRNVNGERVGTSKLTLAQVQAMKIWAKTGMQQYKIAAKFGVGQDTVSRNVNGKRWNHLMEGV